MAQDVLSADLVVKHVEAKGGLRLSLAIELSLKGPDLFRRCQAHRQSPSPRRRQKAHQKSGSFAPPPLHGINAVGSEEAPIEGLASVRHSNGTCSFPAFRFHEWLREIRREGDQ